MNELKKAKRMLWLFGIFKIRLIGFVRPRIIELTQERMVVKIPLRRRTKNHLNSMYFGALAIGADLSGAFQAFQVADRMQKKLSIVFKDFHADFQKRPESDVFFVSEEGKHIEDMVNRAVESGERITEQVKIAAVINYHNNPETVAEFSLGLSLKYKGK